MDKPELLSLINGVRAGTVLGLVLCESMNASLTASVIRGKQFGFEHQGRVATGVDLTVLADRLEDPTDRAAVSANVRIMLRHALIRNTFELVLHYVNESGQLEVFRAWDSYHFVRLMRNTLSHTDGVTLHKWSPPGLERAVWRDRCITPQDVGKPIALEPAEYIWLSDDMRDFVITALS